MFALRAHTTDTLAYNTAIGACGAQGEWQRALRYLDVRLAYILSSNVLLCMLH
jgi:pentatricopeptide repeat protein